MTSSMWYVVGLIAMIVGMYVGGVIRRYFRYTFWTAVTMATIILVAGLLEQNNQAGGLAPTLMIAFMFFIGVAPGSFRHENDLNEQKSEEAAQLVVPVRLAFNRLRQTMGEFVGSVRAELSERINAQPLLKLATAEADSVQFLEVLSKHLKETQDKIEAASAMRIKLSDKVSDMENKCDELLAACKNEPLFATHALFKAVIERYQAQLDGVRDVHNDLLAWCDLEELEVFDVAKVEQQYRTQMNKLMDSEPERLR